MFNIKSYALVCEFYGELCSMIQHDGSRYSKTTKDIVMEECNQRYYSEILYFGFTIEIYEYITQK